MEIKKGIVKEEFGRIDNEQVFLFTLTNARGHQVKITNYGGIVTSWTTSDARGEQSGIVIGFGDFDKYKNNSPYFGALIGRFANRIFNGKFTLDGKAIQLAANDAPHHLHGGRKGFDQAIWQYREENQPAPTLLLSYASKDGEEGYPGNVMIEVRYAFTDEDELSIEYHAETDKATPLNLTNHCYFNLAGSEKPSPVTDHYLQVNADNYTSFDSDPESAGSLLPVDGTPFDFRKEKKIGRDIEQAGALAYDQNFALNKQSGDLEKAATLRDDQSGRSLEVYTTQPGMQLYTGYYLDGSFITDSGNPVGYRTALCLETQHFPDSPNRSSFPTTILRAGEKFYSKTVYRVSTRDSSN
ncbi:MAG TPA: aldose epimerase family protein [Chryseolinea sp.]|nr:aldose epimerase family protein [Chryseolinea sp.]